MDSRTLRKDASEIWTRSAQGAPSRVDTHEVRYVDMSGDGVPDAVERVTRTLQCGQRGGGVDIVEEFRRLEYGIGVDGQPAGVAERTRIFDREGVG